MATTLSDNVVLYDYSVLCDKYRSQLKEQAQSNSPNNPVLGVSCILVYSSSAVLPRYHSSIYLYVRHIGKRILILP